MELSYMTAREAGLNPAKLTEMVEVLEKECEPHSIVVQYNDKIVMEGSWAPFSLEIPQMMHSVSKIGASFCIGMAISEGKLSLDDRLVDVLKDEIPEGHDPALEDITIYNLLTMSAGSSSFCNNVYFMTKEKDWLKSWLLEPRIREDIGCAFHYDSGCSYCLSRIVTKVMGKTAQEILNERVFSKMGFGKIDWILSPEGHSSGGWGMYLSARMLAKLGQLMQQGGKWNGEQLIPADWVEEMKKPRNNMGKEGAAVDYYAYHIMAGEKVYAAAGSFGQFMIAFRDYPITIGITAGTPTLRGSAVDICQKYILEALNTDPMGCKELDAKMKSLAKPLPQGRKAPSDAWKNILGKKFVFDEFPREISDASFSMEGDKLAITVTAYGEEKKVLAAFGGWESNDVFPGDYMKEFHSVSYAFDGDELTVWDCMLNTSYREKYTFRIDGDKLACTWTPNTTYITNELGASWSFEAKQS